jgi:MFS superfamily sulfate permease-like transporter
MNNQGKYEEDLLRHYINPEKIEKAPERFTLKVMDQIISENQLSTVSVKSHVKNMVPVISTIVVILLLTAAFLIPGKESEQIGIPFLKLLNNIKSSIPGVDLSSIFRLTLPSVIMYVCLGILVLTLFDRALYSLFHREK